MTAKTQKKKKKSVRKTEKYLKKKNQQQMNRQTNEKTVTRKGLYNQMAFWQLLEEQR